MRPKEIAAGDHWVKAHFEGHRGGQRVTVANGQSEHVRVMLSRLRAELVWPATDATHKQYVNLDANAEHPEDGSQIGIKVRVKDDQAGD